MAEKTPKKPLRFSDAWREARQLIEQNRGRLAVGMVLIVVNALATLVLPFLSRGFVDQVVLSGHPQLVQEIALAAAVGVLLQAASSFALSQLLSISAQRAVSDMRLRVQAHIARLPISYFDSTRSGQLISRIMTDAEGVRNLVGTGLVQLVGGAITASVALGMLFYLNWRMTCVTLVVLACFGGMLALAFTRLRPLFRKRGEINAEVTGRLNESLGAARVIKAYVAEEREEQVFRAGVDRLFQNVARSITSVSTLTAMTTLCVGAISVNMILMGGHAMALYASSHGLQGMSTGGFMQYLLFTGFVGAPVVQMASIGTQISEAFAGLDRIREVMSMRSEAEEHGGTASVATLKGEITFEQVSFAYVPGQLVLRDISFTAVPGATIALVGSSGSGKTTLVSLVMGFQRPLSGRVLVDGRDLRELILGGFRSHLGVVFQDNVLFDGTVAQNIGFARPQASMERIIEAGRLAGCAEFVEGFPLKWETVVGERGVKLSGGQRQRIAIARAILADPRILVLDEATSSLDSESEALVQKGLSSLRVGRTTFVIAHRLSTIRSADLILVLEHGQIVEQGTHESLFAAHGRYRVLHDRQHQLQQDHYLNPGEEPRNPDQAAANAQPAPAVRV